MPGERGARVLRGRGDERVDVFVAHARDRVEREHHVRGLVVGAAQLLRREERRVGLDEDAIALERRCRLPQVFVLRIRDVAGEAHPVAARLALARDRGVAAEAVDHDVLGRTLIQDSKHVLPRVADVDHQRLGRLVRERDVGLERADLILAWRVHAEVVETALPDRHDEPVVQELLDAWRPPPRRRRSRRGDACPPWRTHPRATRRSRATGGSFPRPRRRRGAGRRRRPSQSRPHLKVRGRAGRGGSGCPPLLAAPSVQGSGRSRAATLPGSPYAVEGGSFT